MVIPRVNISLFVEDRGKNKAAKKTIFFVLSERHFIVLKKEERINGRKFN